MNIPAETVRKKRPFWTVGLEQAGRPTVRSCADARQ